MAAWQEEMAHLAAEAMFYASLSGANGWCTDEGDEHRPATYERSLLDALYVARNPLGTSPAEIALRDRARNSRNIKELRVIADMFADEPPETYVRSRNVKIVKDVTDSRHLHPKTRFFTERAAGVEQLMQHGRYATQRDAELEWMMKEAEIETGFSRDDPNPSKRRAVRKKYRALCNRDRKEPAT